MNQAQLFTEYHPMLHSIACRILQSKADAEDILQDTYLKLLSIDLEAIQNLKAYLIRTVVNNCLTYLKALQKKKEEYLEDLNMQEFISWFKESEFFQFDLQHEIDEALIILQTKLEPLERAVFLLREVFDFDYDALQEVLDKKKDHCRQLFSRARKKLFQDPENNDLSLPEKSSLFNSFKNACDFGNPSEFITQLKADIGKTFKEKF